LRFFRLLGFSYFSMVLSYFTFVRGHGGRNNTGRITVRHRGKARMRRIAHPRLSYLPPAIVRFRHYLLSPPARFNASARLTCGKTSPRHYLLGVFPANQLPDGRFVRFGRFSKAGFSSTPLFTFPRGTFVSHLQHVAGRFSVFARARGSHAQVLRRRGSYMLVRLPSGELRRMSAQLFGYAAPKYTDLRALHTRSKLYKAGQVRQLGRRPHVRGCAMNPVDHPHGGRTGESRPSVSPWGILTKGFKTRTKPINPRVVLRSVQLLKQQAR
jgi:large subunit ribosomal protein L2